MKEKTFPFNLTHFIEDTYQLSAKQKAAYTDIMCAQMDGKSITEDTLPLYLKRMSKTDKNILLKLLIKSGSVYGIPWVFKSLEKKRNYSLSRRKNRLKPNVSKNKKPPNLHALKTPTDTVNVLPFESKIEVYEQESLFPIENDTLKKQHMILEKKTYDNHMLDENASYDTKKVSINSDFQSKSGKFNPPLIPPLVKKKNYTRKLVKTRNLGSGEGERQGESEKCAQFSDKVLNMDGFKKSILSPLSFNHQSRLSSGKTMVSEVRESVKALLDNESGLKGAELWDKIVFIAKTVDGFLDAYEGHNITCNPSFFRSFFLPRYLVLDKKLIYAMFQEVMKTHKIYYNRPASSNFPIIIDFENALKIIKQKESKKAIKQQAAVEIQPFASTHETKKAWNDAKEMLKSKNKRNVPEKT